MVVDFIDHFITKIFKEITKKKYKEITKKEELQRSISIKID